jgi:hypothetical protein
MKKIFFTLLVVGMLSACNKDDNKSNTSIVGNWKLIEVLEDPGDGSGTFMSVDSEKTITFNSDGTLTSNGDLCDMTTSTLNPTSGTYDATNATITSDACVQTTLGYNYVQNGTVLIINYPCFEPCQAKYQKQ